jgi:hypothetical protein
MVSVLAALTMTGRTAPGGMGASAPCTCHTFQFAPAEAPECMPSHTPRPELIGERRWLEDGAA